MGRYVVGFQLNHFLNPFLSWQEYRWPVHIFQGRIPEYLALTTTKWLAIRGIIRMPKGGVSPPVLLPEAGV